MTGDAGRPRVTLNGNAYPANPPLGCRRGAGFHRNLQLNEAEGLRECLAPASAPRNPPLVLVTSPRNTRRKEELRWKQKRIGLVCSWLFFMFLFF